MSLQTKLVHKDKNIQRVLDFVRQQAEIDEQLASKVLLESKTVDKMWVHITSEAKKQAINNAAIIDDQTVYNWALHYFIEVEQEKPTKEAVTENDDESCDNCETPKKEAKPDMEQLKLDI
jgi:hypothetical protein